MKERPKPKHPGEALRHARLQAGLPKPVVVRKLGIDLQTLEAIEVWQLDELPPKPYLLPLTRRYCELVDVDFSKLSKQFPEAIPAGREAQIGTNKTKPLNLRRQFVASSFFKVVIAAVAVLIVFGYVFWQSSALGSRPRLDITSPQSGISISDESVLIQGITSQEAQVYINGTSVLVAPNGQFEYSVVLKNGINELRVEAVNNIGGESQKVLTLIKND